MGTPIPGNTTTTAHELIQEQVAAMLVEPLEAASVMLNAGATVIDSAAPVRVPTLENGFTPGWVGENEAIPDDETADFGEIALMPTERKSIKTITRVSNELVRAATHNVSSILEKRLVNDVVRVLDDGLLNGDGTDDTITGLFSQPGTVTVPFDPTDPDSYLDALARAAADEGNPNRFIMSGGDFFELRKIKDNNGRYIMQGGPAEGAPYRIHDTAVTVSNKVPKGKAALLNMANVVIVRDTDPRVNLLTERYAEYDQVGIRVTTRYDLGLLRPSAVIILDSSEASGG